jgi:branched-chain amino acid transport system permease protein
MNSIIIILVDGAVYGANLFLLSVGMTMVYGVLRILNISHGAIFAMGSYMATSLALKFLALDYSPYLTYGALILGAVIVGLATGPTIEFVFLRRIYGKPVSIQLILTFSILLILDDLMKMIWGTNAVFVSEPSTLLGEISVGGIPYPIYNFVLIGLCLILGLLLLFIIHRTRFGKFMVSVINDREMSSAMGINVNRIYTLAFTIGVLCAALGGAFIAPTTASVPGLALNVVSLSFAVIAIGGMGSIEGAALGALIVGLTRSLCIHLIPELELVSIYLIMVIILSVRPRGLLGEVELRRI